MSKQILLSATLLTIAVSATATDSSYQLLLKHGLRVNGSMPVKITLNNHQSKIIRLMDVTLSPVVARQLAQNAGALMNNPMLTISSNKQLPAKQDLGMNGEPVLDQGEWGTCATFGTTAAINAMFPLLDDARVSQLCNLQVGRTLGNGGDGGWQGSFGYIIFNQITQYGYIDLAYQHQKGCGGLQHYPADSPDNGAAMPVDEFTAHSTRAFTDKDWTPIWNYDGIFAPIDPQKALIVLNDVKRALNQGYRVSFATLLDPYAGEAGALGTFDGSTDDTWVMTPEIQKDVQSGALAGHEILIQGYDDHACATYESTENGTPVTKQQCGLLHIRNSWGANAGDKGDYYMSYEHFMGMVAEAAAVGQDVKDKFKPSQNS